MYCTAQQIKELKNGTEIQNFYIKKKELIYLYMIQLKRTYNMSGILLLCKATT